MTMKTLVSFRTALLALLVVASLSACKKTDAETAAPDLAGRVAGQYNFSELSAGGKTYPASETNLKGNITVTRQTATTVSMKVNLALKSTNETYADDSAENVTVVETSGGTVEFRYNTNVIARANGNKLSIDGAGADGVDLTISATK
ncbi:hypothetical protein BH09BAC4_BH09BAC4_16540 [soil metagenome]